MKLLPLIWSVCEALAMGNFAGLRLDTVGVGLLVVVVVGCFFGSPATGYEHRNREQRGKPKPTWGDRVGHGHPPGYVAHICA